MIENIEEYKKNIIESLWFITGMQYNQQKPYKNRELYDDIIKLEYMDVFIGIYDDIINASKIDPKFAYIHFTVQQWINESPCNSKETFEDNLFKSLFEESYRNNFKVDYDMRIIDFIWKLYNEVQCEVFTHILHHE